jgi:hypothetical protein
MEAAVLPRGGVAFSEGVVLIELMLLWRGVGTGLNHNGCTTHIETNKYRLKGQFHETEMSSSAVCSWIGTVHI